MDNTTTAEDEAPFYHEFGSAFFLTLAGAFFGFGGVCLQHSEKKNVRFRTLRQIQKCPAGHFSCFRLSHAPDIFHVFLLNFKMSRRTFSKMSRRTFSYETNIKIQKNIPRVNIKMSRGTFTKMSRRTFTNYTLLFKIV